MRKALTLPILGVLLAIGITTTMDATGLSAASALPLFPLMGLFWYLERLPRRDMGFVWGRWRDYGLAALYPVLILGTIALVAVAARAVDVSRAEWSKAWLNLALVAIANFLVAILTEEGFFRGWLWASLERRGMTPEKILIWTSVAFSLWHVSAVVLPTGFDLPGKQIPVFLVNVAVLGAIWGLLRWLSGSVLVTSLSHGLWNGMTYVLFGFGTQAGALGIKDTAWFGPEVGILGLGMNVVGLLALWGLARARIRNPSAAPQRATGG